MAMRFWRWLMWQLAKGNPDLLPEERERWRAAREES